MYRFYQEVAEANAKVIDKVAEANAKVIDEVAEANAKELQPQASRWVGY